MANVWRSPLCYRAVFGLVGALIAWGVGEIPRRWSLTLLADFTVYSAAAEKVGSDVRGGDLTAEQGVEAMNRLNHAHGGNPYVKIVTDRSYAPREKAFRVGRLRSQDESKARLGPLLWFGVVGGLLGMFLGAADCVVARKAGASLIHAGAGALFGLVGALVVCLVAGDGYRVLAGPLEGGDGMVIQMVGRSAGWGVLGLFLAIAPGALLWSGKRLLVGVEGGVLGGLAGGAMFGALSTSPATTLSAGWSRWRPWGW